MKKIDRVDDVVKRGLCCGCGICEAVCPEKAVSIREDAFRGLLLPRVDENLCIHCGLCLRVCPGLSVDFKGLSEEFLDVGTDGGIIGVSRACYFGHALDQTTRYNSSSGGLIIALLLHAMDEKMIDGALITLMRQDSPLKTVSVLAVTREEILSGSGSKYCPTSIGSVLRQIAGSEGRFAVVALPCQLHGLRKLEEINADYRSKIILHFGLFCANNNTFLGTEYYLKKKGISPDLVESIRYRSRGWPGKVEVIQEGGRKHEFKRGTSERSLGKRLLFTSAFHYDFMIPRCLLCPDLTAELADISFADPWNPRFLGVEKIGKSMIIVRSRPGVDILEKAYRAGVIELEETNPAIVKRSQNTAFKREVGSRLAVRKIFRKTAPKYKGKRLSISPFGIISFGYYVMSYLTPRRWTWGFLGIIRIIRYAAIRLQIILLNNIIKPVRWLRGSK